MSDIVAMSLDEFIKKRKIGRGGKLNTNKKRQGGISRGKKRGRVSVGSRDRRGRLINGARGRGRTSAGRGTFYRRGSVGRGLQRGIGRGRFQGRQNSPRVNPKSRNQFTNTPNSRNSSRGRFQTRRQNLKARFVGEGYRTIPSGRKQNFRFTPNRQAVSLGITGSQRRPGVQSFARKRVERARNVLANRGATLAGGRIGISRFGFVTTSMRNNIQRQQQIIQQKINRAQLARNWNTSGLRSRDDFENGLASQFFNGQLAQQRWSIRKSRSRGRPPRGEAWAKSIRTVRNTDIDLVEPTQSSQQCLNPEIQRRIMILQQQGRRNRGEDVMLDNSISNNFRGPVVTSSILMSDRFRMFMN